MLTQTEVPVIVCQTAQISNSPGTGSVFELSPLSIAAITPGPIIFKEIRSEALGTGIQLRSAMIAVIKATSSQTGVSFGRRPFSSNLLPGRLKIHGFLGDSVAPCAVGCEPVDGFKLRRIVAEMEFCHRQELHGAAIHYLQVRIQRSARAVPGKFGGRSEGSLSFLSCSLTSCCNLSGESPDDGRFPVRSSSLTPNVVR
jgi:hypothetical protein